MDKLEILIKKSFPEQELTLYLYGSSRFMGIKQGEDIDLLCINKSNDPISSPEFFEKLSGIIPDSKYIKHAKVPILTYKDNGNDIQVSYTTGKSDSYLNTEALAAMIGDNIVKFRDTFSRIKSWAKSKGIYSNSMGYLCGFAISVIVAEEISKIDIYGELYQRIYHRLGNQSIGNDPYSVLTLVEPQFNICSKITRGHAEKIRECAKSMYHNIDYRIPRYKLKLSGIAPYLLCSFCRIAEEDNKEIMLRINTRIESITEELIEYHIDVVVPEKTKGQIDLTRAVHAISDMDKHAKMTKMKIKFAKKAR